MAFDGQLTLAAFFAFLGIFFDFFDGFFARKFDVASELGVQLDSLADIVTSGLVPGVVMFQLIQWSMISWPDNLVGFIGDFKGILPYFAFLITLSSCYRLAVFNISDNQKDAFIGLPTPANAILILSLPLILNFQDNDSINELVLNKWFLIAITILSTWLLNAPIKLLSFKFKNFLFNDNMPRYILILISLISLVLFKFIGIPIIIVLYILVSLFTK